MTAMATYPRSDSPATRARSTSPAGRQLPTDETIEQIIQQATANAKAASGGRTPVIGRDTRTQLFVGNLPYRVRWQDLKDLFRKAGGTVLRADVSLGPDNRSRGYGTVLLSSAEDAGRAIDMFNGYVWQTRTLEVRPDRLPNDFDMVGGNGPTMAKLQPGLSPQVMTYGNLMGGGGPSALHSLSTMSPSSGGSASLPPTSLSTSSVASNVVIGPSSLSMSTSSTGATGGMVSSSQQQQQDPAFSTADVRATSFLVGDITRSPSAFKMAPSSSFSASQKPPFDGLGLSSGPLASTSASGALGLGNSNSGFSMRNGSSPPNDQLAGRTVYVNNWPSQFGPLDFEKFFRNAGNVLRSDFGVASGMDNRGHGTIVYSSEEEAKKAVAHFNGFDLHGWILRVQIGKVEHQQQGSAQLVGDAKATAPRRRSGEYQTSANTLPTAPNPATVTAATEPTYSYPTYMTMAPTGYMVASQPGSPYDQYPPSMTYVPVTSSPVAAYPPSLNGGMYTYSTWHHQPPPGSPPNPAGDMSTTVSNGAGVVPKGPNTSSAALGGQNTAASSTTATSSTTRTAPGRITLPNPGMGMYPPAPVSPMHGRPPITPSMPSFSFVQQPMPTPPLHPQFLSPGLGPYSPVNASPGFYRPMNHYFNLAPGAPVHYHHDPNAMSNNGVIGSGANRHGMLGGFLPSGIMSGGSTPYFDMTAATAGSDAPQEYFPPMPITASLAGAVHSMNLSATSATNSAVGSSTGASSNDSSRLTTGQNSVEEDAPYLEPVGVGRDGFPSLSAKHSDKSVPSASRTGLTEWVTTPDDLPTSASGEVRALTSQRSSVTHDPALSVPTPVPTERPISADPSSISSSKKLASPTSTVLGTAGSTSPGSTGSGPIYSSSNKPKLNLGPIPRFQPSERMMNAYSAIANGINRTASGSGGGSGGGGVPGSASSMQKAKAADTPKSSKGSNGSGVTGGDKSSIENAEAAAASQGVSAAGALKVNGTSSGFRDSMSADAGAGGTRRASWTEDASKRQAILNALNGVYAHDGENVR